MGLTICFIIGIAVVILSVASTEDNNKNAFYNQSWYDEASKEFGDDYYYPPATHRTCLNDNCQYIRTSQHYRPVRNSTYSPTFDKLTPWFFEVKLCYDGGQEKLLSRKFN